MPGSNSLYGFISSEKPFSGSTPFPTPVKYSYGKKKKGVRRNYFKYNLKRRNSWKPW